MLNWKFGEFNVSDKQIKFLVRSSQISFNACFQFEKF